MDYEKIIKFGVEVICPDINSRGSGFILRKDGLIGTNWHVVHDLKTEQASSNVKIILASKQELVAHILKISKEYDFAMLKVNEFFDCEPEFGEYSQCGKFQEVYFIGRGLDIPEVSLHRGWVSAKTTKDGVGILQIDGPINQGNSGGPVFNINMKLIGIVTQTEAKFSNELLDLMQYLGEAQKRGSVGIFGVNPLEVFRHMIYWLNRNRNVGVGYAFSIDYIKKGLSEL